MAGSFSIWGGCSFWRPFHSMTTKKMINIMPIVETVGFSKMLVVQKPCIYSRASVMDSALKNIHANDIITNVDIICRNFFIDIIVELFVILFSFFIIL